MCESERIASILYGMPTFSQELQRELDEGRTALGGCCLSPDNPKWQCADCGHQMGFPLDESPEPQ
jgi:hypothetical protein